jgi:hypothetical protein
MNTAHFTPRERTPMTAAIDDANDLVRAAVAMRRERQAAGKPVEEWYDVLRPVTPSDLGGSDEETQQPTIESDCENKLAQFYRDQFAAFSSQLGDADTHTQPTTSQRFLDLLDEMRRLHESKSADYGSETDPLANIRQGAEFVGIEPWRGCMVRIADKVQRLKTYCRTGRLVHEGVRDTLLDLSAYSLLAIVLFDEGQQCSND